MYIKKLILTPTLIKIMKIVRRNLVEQTIEGEITYLLIICFYLQAGVTNTASVFYFDVLGFFFYILNFLLHKMFLIYTDKVETL